MRVAFLSSYPPDRCGVGDYTAQLVGGLEKVGLAVKVISDPYWRLSDLPRLKGDMDVFLPDVVHIQYPAASFGMSICPHLMAFGRFFRGRPLVVTFHEFAYAHPLRKLADLPFAILADRVIFTNEFERAAFARWVPGLTQKGTVIPIGSSISFITDPDIERDPMGVVYFGLIRPHKGIEDFLALTRLAGETEQPFKFSIIGIPKKSTENYYESLRLEYQNRNNLEWRIGLSEDQASMALRKAAFAYLPFPDGASERRSSLLAALGNGLAVITTSGPQTPACFSGAVRFASGPPDALEQLKDLLNDRLEQKTLQMNGKKVLAAFSWDTIVQSHIDTYESLLLHQSSPQK